MNIIYDEIWKNTVEKAVEFPSTMKNMKNIAA